MSRTLNKAAIFRAPSLIKMINSVSINNQHSKTSRGTRLFENVPRKLSMSCRIPCRLTQSDTFMDITKSTGKLDLKQISAHEEEYKKERDAKLAKYDFSPDVLVIIPKSERKQAKKPIFIKNTEYSKDLERLNGIEKKSEMFNKPMMYEMLSEEVMTSFMDDSNIYEDRENAENLIDENWLKAIELQCDDVGVPEFLKRLPDLPSYTVDLEDTDSEEYVDSFEYEDPIQSAFEYAKKLTADLFALEEEEKKKAKEPLPKREMTPDEITKEWGFKDPSIGKMIHMCLRPKTTLPRK